MSLWNEQSVAEATGGVAQGKFQAGRVEIDSRKIQPGDIFLALKGERFDGHEFVAQAFAKGAVAAIVEHEVVGVYVKVADTQKALEALGIYNRARSSAKIIGITGSVGKTSAKEMLKLALAAHGETYATSGNYNNHIGTPLNLANMPMSAKFGVFEMGMNHAGEITHLTKMVRPDIAAITAIEAVHLEFFSSVEAIAAAKAEVFEGGAKMALLNADQPYLAQLMQKAKESGAQHIITFGKAPQSDCRLLTYHFTPSGCAVKAQVADKEIEYKLAATGEQWALASLMVLGVAQALGLDVAKTAAALAQFSEVEGRGKVVVVVGNMLIVNDSYNASPASMRAGLAKTIEVWKSAGGKGRKIALLGDMLELGQQSPALHAGLAPDLAEFDKIYSAGRFMKFLQDALPAEKRGGHAEEAMGLLALLEFKPNDVVLIKGSHGSKMYLLAEALMKEEGKKHAV